MKRLFFQTKIYDYTTEKEAIKDIEKMKKNGWFVKEQTDGTFVYEIYENGQNEFPYSVEYYKGR